MYLTQSGILLIDTIERTMEDNNPDTTAELAHLAAILALKEQKKAEVPTTSEATRRWIDTFSDCA